MVGLIVVGAKGMPTHRMATDVVIRMRAEQVVWNSRWCNCRVFCTTGGRELYPAAKTGLILLALVTRRDGAWIELHVLFL